MKFNFKFSPKFTKEVLTILVVVFLFLGLVYLLRSFHVIEGLTASTDPTSLDSSPTGVVVKSGTLPTQISTPAAMDTVNQISSNIAATPSDKIVSDIRAAAPAAADSFSKTATQVSQVPAHEIASVIQSAAPVAASAIHDLANKASTIPSSNISTAIYNAAPSAASFVKDLANTTNVVSTSTSSPSAAFVASAPASSPSAVNTVTSTNTPCSSDSKVYNMENIKQIVQLV